MPVDLFHHQKIRRVGLAEVVDSNHVFVKQPSRDLRLKPQLLTDLLAALLLEHLDRDLTLQELVGRGIDRSHAATAQLLSRRNRWLSVVPIPITVRLPPQ